MRQTILTVLTLLLFLPATLAAWKTTTLDYMSEGNNAYVDGVNVRVTDIDTTQKRTRVELSNGNTFFKGWIKTNHTEPENIRVTPVGYRGLTGTPQVQLAVSDWVTAELGSLNLPPEMYKFDAYKTFIRVKNTGTNTATFTVALTGDNVHIERSDSQTDPQFSNSIKTVRETVRQDVKVPGGEERKVYFEIQPTKERGTVSLTYSLYESTQANQSLASKNITVPVVNEQVGYIEDITVSPEPRAGAPTRANVKIRHSWSTAAEDYYLTLSSPNFKIRDATRQVQMFPQRTKTVTYTITPYGGGDFILQGKLNYRQQTKDRFHIPIDVFGQQAYVISNVKIPARMQRGRLYEINATIANNGQERNDIAVNLESGDFKQRSPQQTVRLAPGSTASVTMQIEPITEEATGTFTLQLADKPQGIHDKRLLEQKVMTEETYTATFATEQTNTIPDQTRQTPDEQPVKNVTQPDVSENITENITEDLTDDTNQTTNMTTKDERETNEKRRFISIAQQYWHYAVIAVLLLIILYLAVPTSREDPEDALQQELEDQ